MALLPRPKLALAAVLWIAVAVGGVVAPAHALSSGSGTPTWDSGTDPWDATRLPADVLVDAEDNPAGLDGLPFVIGLQVPDARRHPITGRDWHGGHRRFLTPFETGPPSA